MKAGGNTNTVEELPVLKENEHPRIKTERKEKKSDWRAKHENFIKNLRKNRNKNKRVIKLIALVFIKACYNFHKIDKSSDNDDMSNDFIHCKFCQRNFAPGNQSFFHL